MQNRDQFPGCACKLLRVFEQKTAFSRVIAPMRGHSCTQAMTGGCGFACIPAGHRGLELSCEFADDPDVVQ